MHRFGSPDPRDITLPPEEVPNDRSRLKGGHIGESPSASKEKFARRVCQGMGRGKSQEKPGSGREGAGSGNPRLRLRGLTLMVNVVVVCPVMMLPGRGAGGGRQHGEGDKGSNKGFHCDLQNE